MANTPKARHSKTKRDPVTIDLDPESVSRTPKEADEPPAGGGRAEEAAGKSAAPQPAEEAVSEPRPDVTHDEGGRKEEAAAETTAAADAAATPPRRTGRALLAGIAGGIVALLLAGGLQWAGVLPVPQNGGDDASVAALRQDIGDIESRLAGMENGAGGGASAVDLSALAERVGALDSSLETVQGEVAGLKEAPPAGADASAIEQRLSHIEQQVQGSAQSADTLGDLSQRIARLEQGAAAAEGDAGQATENANRLAALQGRLDALDRKVEAHSEQPQIARLVAATALKSAVDRGVPFDGELQAYAALAPEAPGLAALQDYAADGVPTRAALAGQVSAVASRIVSAEAADSDAGFWRRLWASARSLVVVRPVGEVEGDGVPAIAARFEAHVKAGDYAAALAEYDRLPPEAKAAAAAFADRLKARAAADRIMDEALTGALKAG